MTLACFIFSLDFEKDKCNYLLASPNDHKIFKRYYGIVSFSIIYYVIPIIFKFFVCLFCIFLCANAVEMNIMKNSLRTTTGLVLLLLFIKRVMK